MLVRNLTGKPQFYIRPGLVDMAALNKPGAPR